jgi:Protein of unknown function (DUF3072)
MASHSHRTSSTSTASDPHKWNTDDEPMTAAQRARLETLTREAGEDFDPDVILTKAEAELRIEELERAASRGETGGTVED